MPRRSRKIPYKTPKEQVDKFLENTTEARLLSQKCRDYYDGKQWTEREVEVLAKRKQAPIVVNRIKPKIDGMIGLLEVRKTDPKAMPRTIREEEFAHVVTDGLRYVEQKEDLDEIQSEVAQNMWVEGYGAAIVDIRNRGNEFEIVVNHIPWDRFYYDPHSRDRHFRDARYMGMLMWVDLDDLQSMFPNTKIPIKAILEQSFKSDEAETTSDRPIWYQKDGDEKRVRVAMHFTKRDGRWKMNIFVGDIDIFKEQDSPYHDEDGQPTCPIIAVSANVDADGMRYGEAAGMLSQQDELNHRRSKYLHQNSTRQTYGNEQSITDVAQAKKELAKPDGHLVIQGNGKFGEDFGIITTNDMSQAQYLLYQDAKDEMDRNGFSAPLAGNLGGQDISGKALKLQQEGSALELNRQYAALKKWKNRVYEQIWYRIRQFWNEEKWIRVTDDQDKLRWVGFNSKVTAKQIILENIKDERLPPDQRQKNAELLQFLTQTKNPRLNEVVEIRYDTAKLNVDITVDQSFDVANIQREQFELIAKFAQAGQIDVIELIELSELRGKDELVRKLKEQRQQAQQLAAQKQQQEGQAEMMDVQSKAQERQANVAQTQANIRKTQAETIKTDQESVTAQIENVIVANNPDRNPQVHV